MPFAVTVTFFAPLTVSVPYTAMFWLVMLTSPEQVIFASPRMAGKVLFVVTVTFFALVTVRPTAVKDPPPFSTMSVLPLPLITVVTGLSRSPRKPSMVRTLVSAL